MGLIHHFRNFMRREDGAISIIGAIALPVLIGIVALVAEFGYGLLTKAEHQRVADLSAYAGALAYNSTSSEDSMKTAAKAVAALNGIPAADVSTTLLLQSPRTASRKAVSVTIASQNTLFLAQALGRNSSLPISANAQAELGAVTDPCIIALSSTQTGVTLSGGTAAKAAACSINSNASLTAPCGTSIQAKAVAYDTSVPASCDTMSGGSANILDASGNKLSPSQQSTVDPLAANTAVAALRDRIPTVAAIAAPAGPTTTAVTAPTVSTGTDYTWGYDGPAGTTALTGGAAGCSATKGAWDGVYTITCTSGGTYTFGSLKFNGKTLNFNTSGTSATTYKFSGSITIGSATATFGPGTYTIAEMFSNGSSPVTFGTGSFSIGQSLTTGSGALTFGAGTFTIGQSITTNSGALTFGAGSYTIGQSITSSSANVTFGAGTYSIGQTISNGSGTMSFGAGTFNIGAGLSNSGSGSLSFGAGTFNIGASTTSCGGGLYSICNTSSGPMYFGGPSTFKLTSGIYNGGGARITLGNGSSNSFQIGPSSNGYSINIGGGSKLTLADATGNSSLFQLKGNVVSGGGSCLYLGAASQHDINGYVSTTGGTTLGAGIWTINGYLALGDSSGGAIPCDGTTIGLAGAGVTIVLSGTTTPSGTCAGNAFCAAAGYNNITLTAPAAGTNAKLAVIGPAANSTGAYFSGGASGVSVSGTFYFPSGPVALSGGASLGDGSGQCLELIGSRVTLGGGTAVASTCITSGSSGGSAISLVQ